VFVEGNLFRVAGKDADAIGKEPPVPLELAAGASDETSRSWCGSSCARASTRKSRSTSSTWAWCTRPREGARGRPREVEVKMTLTAPACGMGDILVDDVRNKLEMIPTVTEADVELVFDPPWNPHDDVRGARLETGMLLRTSVASNWLAATFLRTCADPRSSRSSRYTRPAAGTAPRRPPCPR
jgi:metal-sulfur cluster biosynthetic enzyme